MTEAIETLLAEARRARGEGRASDSRNAYARAAGHASEALAHAEQAASVYRAKGPPLDLANALRLKALALDDLRRPDQAAAVWIEARDLYAAEGVAAGVAECEARLAPAVED